MNRILIIGSTGIVGSSVIGELTSKSVSIRALTRDPGAAQFPSSVELAQGDLTHPESLLPALQNIDAAFLVWTAPPATIPAAIDLILKHVQRIVFLSAPIKTPHPFFQQPNAARKIPEQIEALIEDSGADWTFLRPGMFADNSLLWWSRQIRSGETVRWPYLSVPTAPVDERDIAAVAARVLLDNGHAGRDYVLTGPESLTHFEQISTIGDVIGTKLRIEELTRAEARIEVARISNNAIADMLLDAWAAAAGLPAWVTSTIEQLTGAPARTYRNWVADHISHFRPSPTIG